MLGIISIATLMLIAIFMILIIIGGNMSKSDAEREYELEEQAKYIREYNEKHNKNKKSIRALFKALFCKERKN